MPNVKIRECVFSFLLNLKGGISETAFGLTAQKRAFASFCHNRQKEVPSGMSVTTAGVLLKREDEKAEPLRHPYG